MNWTLTIMACSLFLGLVFLDYGSGLGRVPLMAAQYPFRRVLGVELSTQRKESARPNVACCRGRLRCRDIEVIQADAMAFVPPPDVSVMYLYSPFGPTVLPRVLDNIHQSLAPTHERYC